MLPYAAARRTAVSGRLSSVLGPCVRVRHRTGAGEMPVCLLTELRPRRRFERSESLFTYCDFAHAGELGASVCDVRKIEGEFLGRAKIRDIAWDFGIRGEVPRVGFEPTLYGF